MLARSTLRALRNSPFALSRQFCDGKKPPKGFEKFYKKKDSDASKKEEGKQSPDQEPQPSKTSFSSDKDQNTGSDKWKFDFNFNFGGGNNPAFWWLFPGMLIGGAGYMVY
jgi:AFG3 family protein